MPEAGGLLNWILGLAVAAVAAMWRLGESKNTVAIAELKADRDTLKAESKECRKDREDFRVKLAETQAKTSMLEKQLNLYIKKHADDIHG